MPKNSSQPKGPRTRPNYFYSIISVALVLFLLGFFGLIILHGQQFIKIAKEKIEIIVELEEMANDSLTGEFKDKLIGSIYTKPGSVRFIGKEEGALLLTKELGNELMKLDLANPLYDVFTFNVNAAYLHPDSLSGIREKLREYPFVSDVFYQESLVDAIARNIRKISWIALGIGIFFIFVAVTLIHNTLRLALYSNRFLIKNMELVGASWEFISYPYIWRSLKFGVLSALLAIAGLCLLLFGAKRTLPEIEEVIHMPGILIIFAGLMLIGMIINTSSTYYVVHKYLRMRVDDLY